MAALLSHSFPSSLHSPFLFLVSFIAAPYHCSQMFSPSSVTPVQIIAVSTHTMARLSSPWQHTFRQLMQAQLSSFTVAESIMNPTNTIQATNTSTETIAGPSTQLPVSMQSTNSMAAHWQCYCSCCISYCILFDCHHCHVLYMSQGKRKKKYVYS